MPAAVPFVLAASSAVGAGAAVKGARDARKGQKEQLAQTERLASEAAANQPQQERAAADLSSTRRRRRAPGFTDAGAASVGVGTTNTALGY